MEAISFKAKPSIAEEGINFSDDNQNMRIKATFTERCYDIAG